MAIPYVQSGSARAAATPSVTLNGVAADSTLIIGAYDYQDVNFSVTDTAGVPMLDTVFYNPTVGYYTTTLWSVRNCLPGTHTISMAGTGGTNALLIVFEIAASVVFDQAAYAVNAASTFPVGPLHQDDSDETLLISFVHGGGGPFYTAPTGWVNKVHQSDGSYAQHAEMAMRVVSARDAYTADWTNGGNPNQGIIAAYTLVRHRAASGGASLRRRAPVVRLTPERASLDAASPLSKGLVFMTDGESVDDAVDLVTGNKALTMVGLRTQALPATPLDDGKKRAYYGITWNCTQATFEQYTRRSATFSYACLFKVIGVSEIWNHGYANNSKLTIGGAGLVTWDMQVIGGYANVVGSTNVLFGKWQHIVATYDKSYAQLYLNGALIGQVAETRDVEWGYPGNPLTVPGGYINGYVRYLAWWNRPLQAHEVRHAADVPYTLYTPVRQASISVPSTYAPAERLAFRGAPAIITARQERSTLPNGRCEIDHSHQLASGLVTAWGPMLATRIVSVSGSSALERVPDGSRFSASTSPAYVLGTFYPASGISFGAVVTPEADHDGYLIWRSGASTCSLTIGNGRRMNCRYLNDVGSAAWMVSTSLHTNPTAGSARQREIFSASLAGTDGQLYVRGKQEASAANVNATNYTSSADLNINSSVYYIRAAVQLVCCWSRSLSAYEHAWFAAEPFSMLMGQRGPSRTTIVPSAYPGMTLRRG